MLKILLFNTLLIFLQLCFGIILCHFFYNIFSRMYLKGKQWSTGMPDMLKEDKVTSGIFLSIATIFLGVSIIINVYYKFFVGFYLVSLFLFYLGSSIIFPPKGRKVAERCYVMRYHKDHFIVTLNGRKIYVTGERFSSDFDQIIYRETSPQWLPPYENEEVSEKDYDYVLNAILKFLTKKKKKGIIKYLDSQ